MMVFQDDLSSPRLLIFIFISKELDYYAPHQKGYYEGS